MPAIRSNRLLHILTAWVFASVVGSSAPAGDPENCLMCHRYRGLARLSDDGKKIELYHVEPDYYDHMLGPHARLRCTDCHEGNEVRVIPHNAVSPVDCARSCHVAPGGRSSIEFSHARIAEMLERSVHTADTLDECNRLLGDPLGPGQSRCLLCHDEPRFRRGDRPWFDQEAPLARCQVCHTGQLQVDTRFSFWHVHARSRPARSNHEVVRICAVCHSHGGVREAFDLPDSTASYLSSFHGKAMLLGNEATAACLDCHVGEMENVHLMQPHLEPAAPTNAGKLPDTCRSAACHPGAGAQISAAAIHLELTPSRSAPPDAFEAVAKTVTDPAGRNHKLEYYIATLFVILILVTFGPSLVLQSLELLQIVVGRRDPTHQQRKQLADRLLAEPKTRRALHRFTPHQRVQHWVLFICFTALVLTGFPIKFADRDWARWIVELFGGLSVTRAVHRWAGFVLVAGALYHLIYVAIDARRKMRANKQGLVRTILGLPMVFTWADIKKLVHLLAYLLFFTRKRPESGRFGLREKFEYFGVFWGCALLGVTGLMLWEHAWTTRYVTGRLLTVASLIHSFEAFLALLHVGVIHMIGVIFSPSVFPMSMAMISGDTPAEEMADAHGLMLTDVEPPKDAR